MRLLVLINLSFLPAVIFAQETKFVTNKTLAYTEEYFVLKSDKKIKHGTYIKYRPSYGQPAIMESGNYTNGKKDGLWIYFQSGFTSKRKRINNSIREKVNYKEGLKNGLWTSYYMDTVSNIAAEVSKQGTSVDIIEPTKLKQAGAYNNDKRVGEWVSLDFNGRVIQKYNFDNSRLLFDASLKDSSQLNVNRKALFIGGKEAFRDALNNSSHFEAFKKIKRDTTHLTIKFSVDETGMTNNLTIDHIENNDILKNHIQDLISSTNGQWIPALKDGKNTKDIYQITFDIIRTNAESKIGPYYLSIFKVIE